MKVVFNDESRVNKGSAVEKAWEDTTPKSHYFFFWKVFPQPSIARGPRVALVHTGDENDFLHNAQHIILCKCNATDSHDEMGRKIYNRQFRDQVLPNLRANSVIMLDSESYDLRKS
jgi:hypothetical protein